MTIAPARPLTLGMAGHTFPQRVRDRRLAGVRKLIAVVSVGALWLVWGAGAPAAPVGSSAPPSVGSISEAPVGASTLVYLFGLASGPDGDLWFAQLGCMGLGHCAIGTLTPGGGIREFRRGLNAGSVPYTIATGTDGDLWFTDEGRTPAIGRITARGRITEFSRGLARGSLPFEITAGPGGDVWFTDQGTTPAIGRITPRGQITEFRRGLRRGSVPFGITAERDREVWFTDRGCSGSGRCALGRVTASGRIAELSAGLRHGSQPLGIAAGRGGAVWFADSAGAVGRVTPAGRITEQSRGLKSGSSPVAIAPGPDGNMWFTDDGSTPAVGSITRQGRIREFSAGLPSGSAPASIVPLGDGRMWFSDEGSTAALGQVATGAPRAVRASPTLTASPRGGGRVGCAPAWWAAWAGLSPSPRSLAFDGYRWLRDGSPVSGPSSDLYTPRAADAGARLACRETVTYPAPLRVTVSATSSAQTVSSH